MKIYLDQNIYSYLVDDPQKIGCSLSELPERLNGKTLVLSIANCYELSMNRNIANIIPILEKCNKVYLPLAFHLQKEELKQYIYLHDYNTNYTALKLCVSISQIFTFFDSIPSIPLNGSLRDYIAIFRSTYLRKIHEQAEAKWLEAAKTVRSYRMEIINHQYTLFRKRIKDIMPNRDPNNKPINSETKKRLLDALEEQKTYEECPTLYLEDLFFKFRYIKNNFKPEKNDARDIEHIICGLSSSDIFITNDKKLLDFCKYAKEHYRNMPRIGNNFSV